VLNLEEYCAITGDKPLDADIAITAFCAEFGGSPEVAGDGVIVYRFDDLLLNVTQSRDAAQSREPVPFKKPLGFSTNPKKMNGAFAAINTVNLLFGGYFLYNSLFATELNLFTYFYAISGHLLSAIFSNVNNLIFIGLGIIPVAFSFLFWLIPVLRNSLIKKQNKLIKMENYRIEKIKHIYDNPLLVKSESKESDEFMTELSFFGNPEVTQNENGEFVYSFDDIKRDKDSTEKYRDNIKTDGIGKIVFDA
jgi:hypothetical protein